MAKIHKDLIGLVDPILPAISHELNASPSEVTLLFTSYLVVTAVAMLITNWVSSRLGTKQTLIAGLALIAVFSALAGASPSINGIIGFRAGWRPSTIAWCTWSTRRRVHD
jgi:ACDE family multidrug resistance protein